MHPLFDVVTTEGDNGFLVVEEGAKLKILDSDGVSLSAGAYVPCLSGFQVDSLKRYLKYPTIFFDFSWGTDINQEPESLTQQLELNSQGRCVAAVRNVSNLGNPRVAIINGSFGAVQGNYAAVAKIIRDAFGGYLNNRSEYNYRAFFLDQGVKLK